MINWCFLKSREQRNNVCEILESNLWLCSFHESMQKNKSWSIAAAAKTYITWETVFMFISVFFLISVVVWQIYATFMLTLSFLTPPHTAHINREGEGVKKLIFLVIFPRFIAWIIRTKFDLLWKSLEIRFFFVMLLCYRQQNPTTKENKPATTKKEAFLFIQETTTTKQKQVFPIFTVSLTDREGGKGFFLLFFVREN